MRISRLQIDQFGTLSDTDLVLPGTRAPVVVLGANEAGKSTLLAFLRSMLFGLVDRRQSSERVYPVSGERIGVLGLETERHRTLRLERRPGPRGGHVRILDAEGREHPESTLGDLLGGVNREVYRTVYAFSLNELQQADTLARGSVSDAFYAASLGTDVPAMLAAQRHLRDACTEIFKPRGQKTACATLLSQLKTVNEEREKHLDDLTEYNRLLAERKRFAQDREAHKTQLHKIKARFAALERAQAAWPHWAAFCEVRNALNNLPPAAKAFPASGVERLERLLEKREELLAQQTKLNHEIHDLDTKLETLGNCTRLEPAADQITALADSLPAATAARQAIAERQNELDDTQRREKNLRESLGPDWTEQRVEAADASLPVVNELAKLSNDLTAAHEAVRSADTALAHHDERLSETEAKRTRALAQASHAREALRAQDAKAAETNDVSPVSCDDDALLSTPAALRSLFAVDERLGALAREAEFLDAAPTSSANGFRPWRRALWAGCAVLVLAGAWACGSAGIVTGIPVLVAAVFCACAAAVLTALDSRPDAGVEAAQRRRAELRQNTEELQQERQQLAEQLSASIGKAPERHWTPEALEARCNDLRQARERIAQLDEEHHALVDRRAVLAKTLEQAKADDSAASATVRQWLAKHDLPEAAEPETARDMLRTLSDAKKLQAEGHRQRDKLAAAQQHLVEFEQRVEELSKNIDTPRDTNENAGAFVQRLSRELQDERNRREQRNELEERRRQRQREQKTLGTRLESLDEERKKLLESGGTETEEGFRKTAETEKKRAQLTDRLSAEKTAIGTVYGPDNLDDALPELGATDPETLERQHAEDTDAIATAERDLENLNEAIGRCDTEIERLATDERVAELKVRHSALLAKLHHASREWTRHRIAAFLIDEAKRRFEEEQQPDVIRHASEFMERFTEGRYPRVVIELDETAEIAVQDTDGDRHPPNRLSRGTAEQLYLAIRLGYIRTTRENAEPLPVVMDDIFVNFDPERRKAAANALAEFAASNQTLYFTCHPDTVNDIRKAAPETTICELRNGVLRRVE